MRLMGHYWRSPRQTISRRENEDAASKASHNTYCWPAYWICWTIDLSEQRNNFYIPVSAIDIEGLLGRELAVSTSFCWKNVVVQDAASSMETLANHGWTFAIWSPKYTRTKFRREQPYPILNSLKHFIIEETASICITNRNMVAQSHGIEHRNRICNIGDEKLGALVANRRVRIWDNISSEIARNSSILVLVRRMGALEHEFVTNSDTTDMICSIYLYSLLDDAFLAVVRSTTIGSNHIISKIHRDVHFCLSNSL